MKRILVVDESRAVRETLALVLGRAFSVAQRPPLPSGELFRPDEDVDLLILGVPPLQSGEPSFFLRVAAQAPYPVLFLVDSKYHLSLAEGLRRADFLVKPFNPYELREKVELLLTRSSLSSAPPPPPPLSKVWLGRYLEFPYLPEFASAMAKRFALTSLPILIVAEAGCGQERVARAICSLNDKAGPWVSIYPSGMIREFLLKRLDFLSSGERGAPRNRTLFLSGLERLDLPAQASLLSFLEEAEERGSDFWLLSSSREDLLERVYRGDFLHALYYRLATLTLRLPPLRERADDLSSLAAVLAQEYGERLRLGKVTLSAEAVARLRNYLWFGNLDELEAVIARTLAIHRKSHIEAGDLVWGIEQPEAKAAESPLEAAASPPQERTPSGNSRFGNGYLPDIRILMNELAHELKNPMVTIKTFTQLLGERFDDADFRMRFQETVGGDIERMDELLEALLDFSRFSHPVMEKLLLYEQLRRVLEEIVPECLKREATIRWGEKSETGEVFVDEAQFRYAFTNVLRTVLSQMKPRGEIQIDIEGEGTVAVSYFREGGPAGAWTQYLDLSPSAAQEEALPLRILLARILLERNGGGMKMIHLDGGKVLIRTELPVP